MNEKPHRTLFETHLSNNSCTVQYGITKQNLKHTQTKKKKKILAVSYYGSRTEQ